MKNSSVIVCALVALAGLANGAAAAVKYVRAEAAPGGDGSSWATAYTQVSVAVAAAAPGDEVWVAAGTYQPIVMAPGVAIYGGFIGTETLREQRDPVVKVTILDGNNTEEHAAIATGLDATAILDGFTLQRGRSQGGAPSGGIGGGGIAIVGGSPMIRGCVITNNAADRLFGLNDGHEGLGGGVYVSNGGTPRFEGCTISDNRGRMGSNRPDAFFHQAAAGGGVAILNASPVFVGCTISGNIAGEGSAARGQGSGSVCCNQSGADGGGVYVMGVGSTPRFESCVFTGNVAGKGGAGAATQFSSLSDAPHGRGGAVFVDSGAPVFVACVFSANTTPAGVNGSRNNQWGTLTGATHGGQGAAIYAAGGTLTVVSSTFAGNTTGSGGVGAPQLTMGPVNFPAGSGGSGGNGSAIAFFTDTPSSIVNCVFTGNSCGVAGAGGSGTTPGANGGGGIATIMGAGPNTFIRNCTFRGNSTQQGVAGVVGSSSKIQNSILWNNLSGGVASRAAQTNSNNLLYNSITGFVSGGTGNFAADPGFLDPDGADNIIGTPDDDLRVAVTSPVVDAGDASLLPLDVADVDGDLNVGEILPLDIAGLARVVDFPGAPGSGVDMGAHELQIPAATCAADLDDGSGTGAPDGGVDVSDLLYFLGAFEAGATDADLDDGSGTGMPEGGVDVSDLLFFLAHFEAGC